MILSVRWYSLFAGSISHNWSPRKAKHRGFSPELESRPSLKPLLPTSPPTPLYGPGAHGRRAASSRPPRHDQEAETEQVENEGYNSATDFEGFDDLLDDNTADDLTTESAATAAAESAVSESDTAPLRTEGRGETSPSELRAAWLEKQKATKLRDAQSRISKSSKKGERSVSGSSRMNHATSPDVVPSTPQDHVPAGGPTTSVQATASQVEVPSSDPETDKPDVPLRDDGRVRVKAMRRRLGLTHGKKCLNCETTNKKDCPGPSQRSQRCKSSKPSPPALQPHPNVVMKTSTQCGFPFPYTSERVDTVEEGLNKRLDKLESVAINTKVTPIPRTLARCSTKTPSSFTLAILAEGQATNARMNAMESRMAPKATMRPPNYFPNIYIFSAKEEGDNKLRSQGAKFAQELQDLRFTSSEQRLSTAEKKVETMWSYMTATSQGEEKEKTQELEVEKDNEMTDHAIAGNSYPKASPDAAVTYALSSEDEFPYLDVRDLDEFDFE
ncbi:hypothetical protein FDENT_1790 [Fusarium denticulatum]|uniref:Uncharacterized protein n=1 Tax=Fusarium denticulatum TaxID=48507 RepID=A0A8H5XHK5_9HYPO|nr:hypothetical protein FDENT_1790 [Fusarium denticulatum]